MMGLFGAPKLRDDLPRYPGTLQLLRVTAATIPGPSNGSSVFIGTGNVPPSVLYVSSTQQLRTDTLSPRDREPCLADDVNGDGLTPGYYHGRLAGSYNSLPVYEVIPGGASVSSLDSDVSDYSLTTSWSNIGTSLTLPANSTWVLMAQLNAQIVSSSSGAGDTISCRFYDGISVVGCPIEFCCAVCASLTYVDAASLVAVYAVGDSGATVNIQGIVNTSHASTGTIIGCDSLGGGQMVGMRIG